MQDRKRDFSGDELSVLNVLFKKTKNSVLKLFWVYVILITETHKGGKIIMNKTEFISAIAKKANLTQKDAAAAVQAFADVLADALKAGDKVALLNFASFELKKRPERKGINPLTKEPITIKASCDPVCKFGKAYKDRFN